MVKSKRKTKKKEWIHVGTTKGYEIYKSPSGKTFEIRYHGRAIIRGKSRRSVEKRIGLP